MRRISTIVGSLALLTLAVNASATPAANSAVIRPRIFNDCPGSTLTTVNAYPGSIVIDDVNTPGCVGFANRHNWRFSIDGTTPVPFNNGDSFRYCATLTLGGTGHGEGGLNVSPWFSQDVDGVFNVRTTDGEIACFGGRLPFYSFTGSQGLTYVKGTPITLEIIYLPNGLSMASPATIEYKITYNAMNYTSGPKAFDLGNPMEDPPYGLWGILNDARVGGHVQFFVGQSGQGAGLRAVWTDICYDALTVAAEPTTWTKLKGLYN